MSYKQCKLTQNGVSQIAWIPSTAAKVGNHVELLTDLPTINDGFWLVNEVFEHTEPTDIIRPIHLHHDWHNWPVFLD